MKFRPIMVAAALMAAGTAHLSRADTKHSQLPLIILDSGHGGVDTGVCTPIICEDELNYDISLRVQQQLKNKGYKTHSTIYDSIDGSTPRSQLTNNSDEYLISSDGSLTSLNKRKLSTRLRIINSLGEDTILVSIHGNSVTPSIRGASTYYPSAPQHDHSEASQSLAETLTQSFTTQGILTYSFDLFGLNIGIGSTRDRIARGENFRLGVFTTIPQAKALVEYGNLRNGKDLEKLLDPNYRERVASAISNGIETYVTSLSR